ncbi:SMP-30/gluconolactonase/LRE family protein [Pontibacter pamirensis]|uniref:SMP-30/gluconolactonase/LRE family protein n=1 Tax=Pontibacter pamirensis TaxID=2562824 RepID=UPI001389A0AA|nr:ATP-binding protein [Pontibacter pamirensis]
MKSTFSLLLLASVLFSCSGETETQETADMNATETATEPSLTKVWETDTVMTTAESTLYDEENNIIYVSNIQGNHSEKDGQGFIAIMRPDGTISQLNWVTGLNAPKGMAIMDGKLYVTDIDELVEINIADSTVTNRYPVQDAAFLNDAATDGEKVYFTDSETGKVHVLENGSVNTVAEGMEGINGLAFNDAGEMFVLDGKGLRRYNMQDKTAEPVNETVTGGDGLVIIDDSTYIASRWQGEIYLIRNGNEHLLLDTKGEESNTADIDYIEEEQLVLVPTFLKNRVAAYKLDY